MTTAELNKMVRGGHSDAIRRRCIKTAEPKIYYATQVGVQPPTIVLFCNDPKAISSSYRRYLLGVFRDQLKFAEVPIKLYLRGRGARAWSDCRQSEPSGPRPT